MKKLLLALGVCSLAATVQAATFTIGTIGTTANINNWPAAEHPGLAIDGNSATKYLNFAHVTPNATNNNYATGYIFTPSTGAAVVTGINFTTANDAVERDPASYRLLGTNAAVNAAAPAGTVINIDAPTWTQISQGPLSLPGDAVTPMRLTAGGNVTFANATAYTTFLLYFPTVKGPLTANSMQIAEARLQTAAGPLANTGAIGGGLVPEPTTALFAGLGLFGFLARRRRA